MKKPILLSSLIVFPLIIMAQLAQFANPVEGVYGTDFIIVNYVDWAKNGIKDLNCGTKTYDGHQGTDVVIKSFVAMDSGVYVLAVDSGTITYIKDGMYDRNTKKNNLGLGNYIEVTHKNKLRTYYGHLRKNSIKVKVGDKVTHGQRIGLVGSSGNSTDPHLHFELWYDSNILIDPFKGKCGNKNSYWKNPWPYDTSFNIWESGMCRYLPHLDSLRERKRTHVKFHNNSNSNSKITYWNLQYGIKKGDSSRIEWYNSHLDTLFYTFTNYYKQDWWLYYYYSYINYTNITPFWKYKYYFNNKCVDSSNFSVAFLGLKNKTSPSTLYYYALNDKSIKLILPENTQLKSVIIHNFKGQKVLEIPYNEIDDFTLDLSALPKNCTYLATIRHKNGLHHLKILW